MWWSKYLPKPKLPRFPWGNNALALVVSLAGTLCGPHKYRNTCVWAGIPYITHRETSLKKNMQKLSFINRTRCSNHIQAFTWKHQDAIRGDRSEIKGQDRALVVDSAGGVFWKVLLVSTPQVVAHTSTHQQVCPPGFTYAVVPGWQTAPWKRELMCSTCFEKKENNKSITWNNSYALPSHPNPAWACVEDLRNFLLPSTLCLGFTSHPRVQRVLRCQVLCMWALGERSTIFIVFAMKIAVEIARQRVYEWSFLLRSSLFSPR